MLRAFLIAALLLCCLAAPAAAQDRELEAAREEAGTLPTPIAELPTPVGRLQIDRAELLAARFDQPVRFRLTLDRDVDHGVLRIGLPRRWRDVPSSGLRPSTPPRGRRLGSAKDAVELVLDGAAAGDELTAEVRDRGIPAGTYELPVSLDGRRIGRLELILYAPVREASEQPWGSLRAINVSHAPGEQSETFVTAVPGNPQRMIAGANGGHEGYSAWISDDGGDSWVERVMPGNTGPAPGPVSGTTTLNNCCDPMSAADPEGNLWYGGLDRTPDSRIVVGRVPAGTDDFVNTVALDARTSGTQDKPMMTIDNNASSPTRGRLYVVWNEPAGGINIVVSFCDTRPGGVLDAARCDNADNWSSPVSVTKATGSYIYADVAVAPDGKAFVTWWNYSAANAIEGAACSGSCDTPGGWSGPTTIATLDPTGGPIPFACPILAQPGGRASTGPNVEVSGKDGRVYVAWSDLRTGSGSTRCASGLTPAATHLTFDSLVKSAAGRLPTTADAATRLLSDADDPNSDDWFPWIAVDQSSGVAYAAFYSTRGFADRRKVHFYVRSVGADGTLGPLVRASDAPSDFSQNACCGFGNDLGDYAGLDATNGVVMPIWSEKSNPSGEAMTDQLTLPAPGTSSSLRTGDLSVDDAGPAGDADGIAEPGEVVTVTIPVRNDGSGIASAATGTLSTSNPKVRIPTSKADYGNIAPALSTPGSYRVHLADDLGCGADLGLRLRVDHGDGAVRGRYSVATGGAPVTVPSTDVFPKAIPDPGQAESTLTMPAMGVVGDVDVTVNVTHPYVGDVSMVLRHPDGTEVRLASRATASNNNGDHFTGTVFDDEAPASLSGSAPFTGSFRPFQALSVLDGKPWEGDWTLRVLDAEAPDAGQLTGWSLRHKTCSAPVPNQPPAAELTAPATALPGETLELSAAASDPDGLIHHYEWDLDGDGSFETDTGTTPHTRAVFADPGTRTLEVRVVDEEGGAAEAGRTVVVAAPPTPAPPVVTPITRSVAPFVALVKPGAKIRARRGAFGVAVRGCAGCRGRLVLQTQKKVRAKRNAKPKRVRLARVAFTIGPKGTVTVRVKLSRSGKALLKRLRRIALTAKLTATDAAGKSVAATGKITLRR